MSIVTIPPFLRHKIQFCEKPTKNYVHTNQPKLQITLEKHD